MGCSAGAIIYLLLESSVRPAHCCHIFPASLLPAGNAAAAGRQAAAVPAAAAPRPRAAAAGVGWSGCGWAGVCAWQAREPRSLSCQRSLSLPMGILQYSASHQATAVGDSSPSLFSLCRPHQGSSTHLFCCLQLVEGAQLLADLIASYEQSLDQQTAVRQGPGGSSSSADFAGEL